jgi:hypothetical protein
MGWYMQQPDPVKVKMRQPMAESYYVMPEILLNVNIDAGVFDVHLVTPSVSSVNLVVPTTTLSTLKYP